ncbi:MAG: hypothetical protein Udaeo2_28420 [Candidatus Udaeobacter sp.]|nr:MAG: hypothetical protein Udaeo2_28420 [Candidatus Udaeobacter sp.]
MELVLLMEEAGRALLPAPHLDVALAGAVSMRAQPRAEEKYLPPIPAATRATLAMLESSASWDPTMSR